MRLAGTDRPVRVPVARPDLAAALDALLGNVFRHTPEGTAFSVDVHNGEDAVIVLVSDAGPGIKDPEAALARGNSGERAGSTGLGLDIVRRVAESTGGDVRIGHSVLGGTEVRVWLGLDGRRTGGTGGRTHRVGAAAAERSPPEQPGPAPGRRSRVAPGPVPPGHPSAPRPAPAPPVAAPGPHPAPYRRPPFRTSARTCPAGRRSRVAPGPVPPATLPHLGPHLPRRSPLPAPQPPRPPLPRRSPLPGSHLAPCRQATLPRPRPAPAPPGRRPVSHPVPYRRPPFRTSARHLPLPVAAPVSHPVPYRPATLPRPGPHLPAGHRSAPSRPPPA